MGTGLEIAALAISAGSAIVGGVSTFMQSRAQAKALDQQAAFERKQADIDAKEFKRRQRRLLSSARAGRGASGVDLLSGSPLLVDDDTIEEIVFGAETIRRGGQVRGTRLEQQAGFTRAQGTGALIGGFAQAGSTALTSDIFSGGADTPSTGSPTLRARQAQVLSNTRPSRTFGGGVGGVL